MKQPEDIIVQMYILCTPIADAIVTDENGSKNNNRIFIKTITFTETGYLGRYDYNYVN